MVSLIAFILHAHTYTYSDGKTIGKSVGPFDSCISTYIRTPSLRYALVAYYGARVSSCYVEIARVRVSFHGMGISLRLSWRPLYSFERPPVAGPSTATLGSPRKPAGYVVFVVLSRRG